MVTAIETKTIRECPRCKGQVFDDRYQEPSYCLQCGWVEYPEPLPWVETGTRKYTKSQKWLETRSKKHKERNEEK